MKKSTAITLIFAIALTVVSFVLLGVGYHEAIYRTTYRIAGFYYSSAVLRMTPSSSLLIAFSKMTFALSLILYGVFAYLLVKNPKEKKEEAEPQKEESAKAEAPSDGKKEEGQKTEAPSVEGNAESDAKG